MAAEDEKMVDIKPEIELPTLSFNVLATIRVAQAQHGVRHGDFQRYRQYCTRRIRKLYSALKLPQGNRNKFIKRPVEVTIVKEVRHLHLPLMKAERAWSQAMGHQKDLEECAGKTCKVQRSYKSALRRAMGYAVHFADLCSKCCEPRTHAEAVGYAAMMKGHEHKAAEQWSSALLEYQKAGKLFKQLSKVGEFEQQALFSQVLEELDPSIRYCNYEMDKLGVKAEVADNDVTLLQEQLEELAVTAERKKDAATVFISWCGVEYPVRNERLQAAVLEAQQLETQFKKENDLDVYDKVVSAYAALKKLVEQALSAGGGANALGVASDLEGLQTAVLGLFLQHSIERAVLQVKHQGAIYDKKLLMTLSSNKAKVRPFDIVKLYDAIIGYTGELGELGMKIGGAQGEVLMEGCAAQVAHYQAARCYYMAHSYLVEEKCEEEAHALFERCLERANKAIGLHEELAEVDHSMIEEMELIKQKASAFRFAARAEFTARSLSETRAITARLGALDYKSDSSQKKQAEPTKYLADNLETWEPFVGTGGKGARIFRIPPPLESMPIRPVLLDTAFNHIKRPDLSSRLPAKGQETWAGKIWGMWGSRR